MKASERSSADFLRDIKDAAQNAVRFVAGVSYEDFRDNTEKVYAVIRILEVIGEAAKNVPVQLRKRYPSVPWRIVTGAIGEVMGRACRDREESFNNRGATICF